MDDTAIQRIEALAAHGYVQGTDVPAVILPEGCSVKSIEHLLAAPKRKRAMFRTERIPDFCRYVDDNGTARNTAVFVQPDGSGAKAVIDYGDHDKPQWGDHSAVLGMVYTPEFAAIEQICGQPLRQRDVTDWLEDWRDIITPLMEGDGTQQPQPVPLSRAVAAIRRIDLKATMEKGHEDGDFSARRTSMEQVEASSDGSRIPGLFRIRCRVYPETQERDISLRLSVLTGSGEPRLQFRVIGRDALLKEIAEEVELDLTGRLSGWRVFVGEI